MWLKVRHSIGGGRNTPGRLGMCRFFFRPAVVAARLQSASDMPETLSGDTQSLHGVFIAVTTVRGPKVRVYILFTAGLYSSRIQPLTKCGIAEPDVYNFDRISFMMGIALSSVAITSSGRVKGKRMCSIDIANGPRRSKGSIPKARRSTIYRYCGPILSVGFIPREQPTKRLSSIYNIKF